jgi:hypothetical protein
VASSPDPARPEPIEALLGRLGSWACLVGPQAAGKTVYSQYLEKYSAGDRHLWTLRSQLANAAGRLTFSQITATRRPLLDLVPAARTEDSRRFWRASGTKDLVVFQATSRRARQSLTETSFFDIPGEAVGRRLPDLNKVLAQTRAVVLFVPVWGLLPAGWLKSTGYRTLYPDPAAAKGPDGVSQPSWGTSLHTELDRGTAEDPIADPEGHRRIQFGRAIDRLGEHLEQWCNKLLELSPRGSDLLIVLSQFQREPFEALYDAYFESRAGSDTWDQYDGLLGAPEAGGEGADLAAVTEKLQRASAIGRSLIDHIRRQAANLPRAGAPGVCETLLRFCRPPGNLRRGELAELEKFRSVSILPLNVVSIRTREDWALWSDEDNDATSLAEMRMCEDLLWWILLHQRGHEIWRW